MRIQNILLAFSCDLVSSPLATQLGRKKLIAKERRMSLFVFIIRASSGGGIRVVC